MVEFVGLPRRPLGRQPQIIARAKTRFKTWDDSAARKVVPSTAEAAIKNPVSF